MLSDPDISLVRMFNSRNALQSQTLAASGISDFRVILDHIEKYSPLRRNVTIDQVGNAALFLASDMASGVTGDVLFVDSGYQTIGLTPVLAEKN